MSNIQSWNPFKELEAMQNRFANFFGDFPTMELQTKGSFYPAIDIAEDKEAFHFKADLPSLKKEDIKVECVNGVLTISGQRKFEKEDKNPDKKYHRIERSYGSFVRSFTLPDNADTEKIFAEYNNGALDIKVAKKATKQESGKTISIK